MRKTVKDPAQGAVGKAEDVPDPSTAPSALPVSGGDEYYEETAEYERNRADSGTMSGLTIFLICSSTMGKTVEDPAQVAVGKAEYVGNRDDSGTMSGVLISLICSSTMGKTVKDPAPVTGSDWTSARSSAYRPTRTSTQASLVR